MATVDELEGVEGMLERMAQSGALDPNSYYKCMASLASDYVVRHLDIEKGLVILNKLPPEYFDGVIVQQMEAERVFAEAMVVMFYRLQQLGTSGNTQRCNMLPGEA